MSEDYSGSQSLLAGGSSWSYTSKTSGHPDYIRDLLYASEHNPNAGGGAAGGGTKGVF